MTVTEYARAGVEEVVEIVRDEVLDPPLASEMLVGLSDAVGPLLTTGETVVERVTVPEKPPNELTVMVDVAVAPRKAVADVGLVDTVNGETVNCPVGDTVLGWMSALSKTSTRQRQTP